MVHRYCAAILVSLALFDGGGTPAAERPDQQEEQAVTEQKQRARIVREDNRVWLDVDGFDAGEMRQDQVRRLEAARKRDRVAIAAIEKALEGM